MNECKEQNQDASLWLINFEVKGVGTGTAIVKAKGPKTASMILKNNGSYNGTPGRYNIYQIEEIIQSPDEMLISEQVLTYND